MYKSYKFRLYPNHNQLIALTKLFGCVRYIYNRMLNDKLEYYQQFKKNLKILLVPYLKDAEWLKDIDKSILFYVHKDLEIAFNKFLQNPHINSPKFKSKNDTKNSFKIGEVRGKIFIRNKRIYLPNVGLVKINLHRRFPPKSKAINVTVTRTPSNKYFVSILLEYNNHCELSPKRYKYLGLDYSVHGFYADSNGNKVDYPKYYRQIETKLSKEKQRLSHMERNSMNYKKQRIKIARIAESAANQRRDFLHKLSYVLANNYDAICIETLDLKEMTQSSHSGKSIYDSSWSMFVSFLKYKLEERGKRLIMVDRWFPSSQICSNCGYRNRKLSDLSIREWTCPSCKSHHDRDINAAKNIRNNGIKMI